MPARYRRLSLALLRPRWARCGRGSGVATAAARRNTDTHVAMLLICLIRGVGVLKFLPMSQQTQKTTDWAVHARWGSGVTGGQTGFVPVPDVLIRNQQRLGLSPTEMVVLLNILVHWWRADKLPHPRPSVIAKRIGVTTRTVERAISSMEEKGLMQRLEREKTAEQPAVRRFDLTGLIKKVQGLAEETRSAA